MWHVADQRTSSLSMRLALSLSISIYLSIYLHGNFWLIQKLFYKTWRTKGEREGLKVWRGRKSVHHKNVANNRSNKCCLLLLSLVLIRLVTWSPGHLVKSPLFTGNVTVIRNHFRLQSAAKAHVRQIQFPLSGGVRNAIFREKTRAHQLFFGLFLCFKNLSFLVIF